MVHESPQRLLSQHFTCENRDATHVGVVGLGGGGADGLLQRVKDASGEVVAPFSGVRSIEVQNTERLCYF